MMNFRITSQIATEPITLTDARKHLRIEAFGSPESHPDDDYIESLISVAREWCEQYTRRALATQTILASTDDFPSGDTVYSTAIKLPLGPLQSVTFIKYYDTDNVLQTLSSSVYYVDYFENAIYLETNQSWPQTNGKPISIEYIAGYTNGESPDTYPFPFAIKAAMLLLIGNYYENRQEDLVGGTRSTFNSLPTGVYNLLQPYRAGLGV
jgi:uncharacterized phiE125 gp8 family phage protein